MKPNKMHRKYYLEDIPLEEAYRRFFGALSAAGALNRLRGESISLAESVGRVTASPVWASVSSPHYHAAGMDGVAVRAEDTIGATDINPVRLEIGSQAKWVDTGDPLPLEFNAVIMVEHLHEIDGGTVEIVDPVAPWQHIRPLGEDIVATELVLPENHLLRPVDVAAAAASGATTLDVRVKPKVAIIPTGTELVLPGAPLRPGNVLEFNSLALAGMIEAWGGVAVRYPPVADRQDLLAEAILAAIPGHDVIIVNAGSSAGSEDYTAPVVESLGKLLVHGVAIRPGHPVVLGFVKERPVIGIPGYPVSAILTCELLIAPLLERLLGIRFPARRQVEANLTRKILSPTGEDEYLRVKLGRVGNRLVATPIQRGAGVIMSMVRADGLVLIPRFSEGLDAGAQVPVSLLRPLEDIDETLVAIGSHDLTLDLLANRLRSRHPPITLSSSNVGSLGGLTALSRAECHIAGSHLLDEETGEYNCSYVRRYLPGQSIVVLHLVLRDQGLIVAPGNPKAIASLEDLQRNDVIFANRQRGSGTRVLLDYRLKQLAIDPASIHSYDREEYTHLAVAAAVWSGSADVGMGILAAASALGLDFVPLLTEQYDLIIPACYYESPLLQPLLETLQSAAFRKEVESLGGYDVSSMGKEIARIQA